MVSPPMACAKASPSGVRWCSTAWKHSPSAFDRPKLPVAPPQASVPIYSSGGDDKKSSTSKKTFADIEQQLMQENELLGLVNAARDVRAAQFQAEDTLNRKLSPAENKRV